MFGFISKKKLFKYIEEVKENNRKENLYAKYPARGKRQEILNAYSQGYESGTDNMFNAICAHFGMKRK